MFRDARALEDGSELVTDVCVVGTGAAGVTCAAELAGSGMRVLMVEAGGLESDSGTEAMSDLDPVDMPVPATSRQRFFGGTTNSWWGKVALLDESDFLEKDWLPGSGWPIRRADLDPYYERACRILGIPSLASGAGAPGSKLVQLGGAVLEDKFFYWTRTALNFGSYHRRNAGRASNVQTLLHANVAELEQGTSGLIERVVVATTGGRRFSIRPGVVVLACGGIENARLMLASRSRSEAGIGNAAGLVGRYYMDHPRGPAGFVEATPALSALWPAYWSGKRLGPGRFRIGVGLTPEARDERRVLNSYVNLNPVYVGAGVAAIRDLYRKRARALRDRSTLGALVTGLPDVARYLAFKRFGRGGVALLAIENFTEQEPQATNAITLSDRKDGLGNPLARVRWSLSALDRRSVRILHEALDMELRRRRMGRVRSPILAEDDDPWRVANDAAHHMGTTRMGRDSKTSVVDPDCRVHGVENLYVAGSSVFPTGGAANPTLTIMAISARIADHIRIAGTTVIGVRSERGSLAATQETK